MRVLGSGDKGRRVLRKRLFTGDVKGDKRGIQHCGKNVSHLSLLH
jgi:hypothetical protein